MRWVLFYHSLVSDWNHGNAHFLRGIASELLARGHELRVYEPKYGWSRRNLVKDYGATAAAAYRRVYPHLESRLYESDELDLGRALDGVDVVLVHEWNDPDLVRRIGEHRRRRGDFRLFFHDTHHRAITAPHEMEQYDLSAYDGVLAFGRVIAETYLERGWAPRAWTWHEAADVRVFRPLPKAPPEGQLVWIGNWGDDERSDELREFLLDPVKELSLSTRVYGVRYPVSARRELQWAGIEYGGWLPNFRVPEVFAQFDLTVHVPRRPYRELLPGIPTIRVFEALACGLPLITAPWEDAEGLFHPGRDYLIAQDGTEMRDLIADVLDDPAKAGRLAAAGRAAILARHTCSHRVDELLQVLRGLGMHVREGRHARPYGGAPLAEAV